MAKDNWGPDSIAPADVHCQIQVKFFKNQI